jgi:Acyl-CoA dehydrogenase, C-terminal domain
MYEPSFPLPDGEQEIADAASASFERLFPVSRLAEPDPGANRAAWQEAGAEGWTYCAVADDKAEAVSLPTVLAVAHAAGQQLLVDEFTNNLVLLPGVLQRISDPDQRAHWRARHEQRNPGYLLCDGRLASLTSDSLSVPWVYGVSDGFDIYQIQSEDDRYVLLRWCAPEVQYEPVGGLALGVGTATTDLGDVEQAKLSCGPADLAKIALRAQLVHSAGLTGVSAEALDRTIKYLQTREQFGVVIGKFQSLKHLVADAYALGMTAWLAVQHAAAADSQRESRLRAARILAREASMTASKLAMQLHGGIGFTWEESIHYFLKTAALSGYRFGSPEDDRLRLAKALAELDLQTRGVPVTAGGA